jgi:hypothetical protein
MSIRAEESKINFGRSFCTGNRERNSHAVVLAGAGNLSFVHDALFAETEACLAALAALNQNHMATII